MKSPYEKIDRKINELKKENFKRFNNLRLTLSAFDEANILKSKTYIHKIFEDIKNKTLKIYLLCIKDILPNADKKMLLNWLEDVYATVQYNFFNEWERKEARYYEAVLSVEKSGKTLNSQEMLEIQKRTINLLNDQIEEFGIHVIDNATVEKIKEEYSEEDEPKFKWVAMIDKKTCLTCLERNGKVFTERTLPIKHRKCRCHYVEE